MKKINITVDEEQLQWIEEQITEGRFASRSHAFRYCVMFYRRSLGMF